MIELRESDLDRISADYSGFLTHERQNPEVRAVDPWGHIFSNRYEVKIIRVLTITRTRLRRDGLAATASELLSDACRKYFLFGSLEDLTDDPASIFNPVFLQPGDAKAARELMPFTKNASSV